MKTLFLTSYFSGVGNLFRNFIQEQILAKQVLFIPTAGNVEHYVDYIDEAKYLFQTLGFSVDILDIANTSEVVVKEKIKQTPCLYISGGNTFYLLQELKKKNLLELINLRISEGMVYIGESAGAMITAGDIKYSQIMDDKMVASELTDYSSFNLVNFAIVPHYGEFPFEESAMETIRAYQSTYNLFPINNHQAVIVKENNHEIRTESQVNT